MKQLITLTFAALLLFSLTHDAHAQINRGIGIKREEARKEAARAKAAREQAAKDEAWNKELAKQEQYKAEATARANKQADIERAQAAQKREDQRNAYDRADRRKSNGKPLDVALTKMSNASSDAVDGTVKAGKTVGRGTVKAANTVANGAKKAASKIGKFFKGL